jgi:asparagine synthetase B (glutamine-hydrolysing)
VDQTGAESLAMKNRFYHERLAIVDPASGKQPLFEDKTTF